MREFHDLESEEEKVQFLSDLLRPIAEKTDGSVRYARDDEEVQCTGKIEKRPFRIVMDSSTGGLKAEMKLRNTVGLLDLNYDPDAQPITDAPDPEWNDGDDERHFLAPGFYLEGDSEGLADAKRTLDALDPAEVARITSLMSRFGIGWVNANASLLSCGLFESLFQTSAILEIVQALHRYAAQFEKEGAQVEAAPTLILGGVVIHPERMATIQTCPYCKSNVEIGADRKCPNCGAAL